ncbi:DUF2147 domain-containing protein [Salibacteraceae bacterium]|jgi:uncharacterized protein (DUF2147 family)|nr:hypothetical protein [Crocinitomicaceae bacterium]MCH9822290.1 DUF2147 domain-containing protein [Bacteroidota bacterium]MDB0057927.1 DUF2147 domain-containing protein [Salibacteraceae bacterium]|tara:strand:+ start:22996 stop:23460 length:465 start_codon:yes stop_codon:yes gene_type:complete
MKKVILSALVSLMLVSVSYAQNSEEANRLIGVWEPSHGKAKVKIDKIGDKFYGRIVWLKTAKNPETGEPRVDKNNPDESLRNTPLRGYRILKDFVYAGEDEWSEGTIYDPENGNTYSCSIKMTDENTLDIRGYIGVSALGRTDIWKRLKMPSKK